jgi:mitochondrial enoyl-[acyl-carrier protein] reductase / trans-2-enoyl-CoA reductase
LGTPSPVFIPGNEGLGEVVQIGPGVEGLKVGDRVVMASSQAGTWSSYMNIKADAVIPIGNEISDVQGATLTVSASIRM